jgi:hypothetical protein
MADETRDYFALKQGREFSGLAMRRVEDYYQHLSLSGRLNLYKRLYEQYHKGFIRGGLIHREGENSEFTTIHTNHFLNILQHLLVMTTSQRPSFEARAENTDHKSQAQAIVGSNVVDYYNREKGMDKKLVTATRNGLLYGEGDTLPLWDAKSGKDYMANPNDPTKILKQGDVEFKDFAPIDVIRDFTVPSAEHTRWKIYREFENKYDLAARFPEAANRIMALKIDSTVIKDRWMGAYLWKETDIVPVYRLIHDMTPSVPQGRHTIFIDSEAPLMDGVLPYGFFPGFRLAPMEHEGTPFGYTIFFDLLCLQQVVDMLYSTVTTNQSNFGVQNIIMPDGANIAVKKLVDGLNLITFDSKQGEPKPLNLTNTKEEIFRFIEMVESVMEMLAGINSVTRGNPEASLKSGAALALVQSMAIQFNSGLQQAYTHQAEGIATALIKILGKYAQTPRIVEIAGRANRSYIKEFTSEDLSGISRVTVDLGNPLARTTAGKVEIAENLLDKNLIETADQYIQVLTTGRLEPLIEGKQAELMLIRCENEALAEGKSVMVAVIDNHVLHIQEHKVVLASPEARKTPEVVKETLKHMQEHVDIFQQLSITNPNLLIALGQQPVQAAPHSSGVTPGPTAPPSEIVEPSNPIAEAAKNINLPQMPENPLTGDKFNLQTGGM